MAEGIQETELVVIGGGPGGYVAAFAAADLGRQVTLVDERDRPGGVCLTVGCIPSKALLHAAELLDEAEHASAYGVHFAEPRLDLDALRAWKDGVVDQLTKGLLTLSAKRGVRFVQGRARFQSPDTVVIDGESPQTLRFKQAIVATGSRPMRIPSLDLDSENVIDSTGALELADVPRTMLVIGGGYIGLELGTAYSCLGSKVTVVEMMDGLLPGADRDLVKVLEKKTRQLMTDIYLETRVSSMKDTKRGIEVEFQGAVEKKQFFEKVLVAVGRTPNIEDLGLENTAVQIRDGFVSIDHQCRTDEPSIFAIGDVAGQPMLAHKAMREGRVAAEVVSGQKSAFDNHAIPAVVFTNPELAWSGITEIEAREQGIDFKVARFPWPASGRALTLGRTDGLTKMIFDPASGRVLGVGIVGPNAGELIAEGTLAIEMAAVAEDLALTIHAHPTLSETVGEVAEVFLGHPVHIYRK